MVDNVKYTFNDKNEDEYLKNIQIKDYLFTNEFSRDKIQLEIEKKQKVVESFNIYFQKYIIDNELKDSRMLSEPTINKSQFISGLNLPIKQQKKIDFELLNFKNLKNIILNEGCFPSNSRVIIWKYLLSLPNNEEIIEKIKKADIHSFYLDFEDIYPVKDQSLRKRTQKILSILSYWCPQIGILNFLPNIVFPFCKIFKGDDTFLIEVLISLSVYWFQHWFEFYPEFPSNYLLIIEKILFTEDRVLYEFLNQFQNKFISFISWEIIRNLFSDNFKEKDWLGIMDFIFTFNFKPEFLLYLVTAYLIENSKLIQKLVEREEVLKFVYNNQYKGNLSEFFKRTISLEKKFNMLSNLIFKPYNPLPINSYPQVYHSTLLEFLKTVGELKEKIAVENKSKTRIINPIKIQKNNSKITQNSKLRENSNKFIEQKKISSDIKKISDELKNTKKSLRDIDSKAQKKLLHDNLKLAELQGDDFDDGRKKISKELKNIENEKNSHLNKIKELESKIESLQKSVNHYKKQNEPFVISQLYNDNFSSDEEKNYTEIIRSNQNQPNTDLNSRDNEKMESRDENLLRSYNLTNSENSNKFINSSSQNKFSTSGNNALSSSSMKNSYNERKITENPINEIIDYKYGAKSELNSKNSRDYTPSFNHGIQSNNNGYSNEHPQLISSKNSNIASLNSLSLSQSAVSQK